MAENRRDVNHYGDEHFVYRKAPRADAPFCVELAGETFPNKSYHISIWPSDAYVYEYIISGKGTLDLGGTEYPIKAGDFCMFSDHKRCEYYADPADPYHKIWVNCRGELNRHLCQGLDLDFAFIIQHLPKAEEHIRTIHGILTDPALQLHDRETACAMQLLNLLSDVYNVRQMKKSKQAKYMPDEILKYIDDHLCEPLTLEQIEKEFFISHTHLSRIFRHEYGASPYQYIILQRINLARSMLANTDLSISDIAMRLGFSDAHYFSYTFKKETGSTPRQYRNANKPAER